MAESDGIRINRFFTDRGLCSRREADRWVEAGRISINGKKAKLGDRVREGDTIWLDGRPLVLEEKRPVILAYNKPVGVECTSDRTRPHNIIDALKYPTRVFHIGRLDQMSEGLILLTNMGEIVNKILRSENGHEKEYEILLERPIPDALVQELADGVDIDDGRGLTKPCVAERMGPKGLRLILTEGRNRQIRRMAEAVGHRVIKLRRVRVLDIELGKLKSGQWRELSAAEVDSLTSSLEGSASGPSASFEPEPGDE